MSGDASTPTRQIGKFSHTALESVAAEATLHHAWLHVRQNRGAPGIDGLTVQEFENQLDYHLALIAKNLLSGRYRPSPLRAVDVPKNSGDGLRTLGIPTVQDRVVLQAIAQVLTPLWEPHFSPYSFAYREGRTAFDAVLLAQQRLQSGQHWIVDLDIEHFFDSVDHVRLVLRLQQRVEDSALLDLIGDFLRAGLSRDGVIHPTRVGIPQGSPLSPLLANIVLDELDQEYMRLGSSFVRYADDCILLAQSEAEANTLLEYTREFLVDRLHLRLNPTKTRIVQPADVGFLGFTYRLSRYGKVSRRITRDALAAFRARIRELTRPHKGQPLEQTFEEVGAFFRGWTNYYRFTQDNTLPAARAFACDALRAYAWAHWTGPQEKLRQLRHLGVSEELASRYAFALDFPDPEDDPPVLRQVLPDTFFERYGLRIVRPPMEPSSEQPLSQALLSPARPPPPPWKQTEVRRADDRAAPDPETQRQRRRLFRFLGARLRLRPAPEWPLGLALPRPEQPPPLPPPAKT